MSKIFISFIGIDGAGKTTLAKKTFQKIRLTDKKIIYAYGRFTPIFTKFLMYVGKQIFLNKKSDMFNDYDDYLKNKKSVFQKKHRLAQIFTSFVILEYFFEVLFKIIIPYKMGYSIITDRYVHDTVINDIAVDLDFSPEQTNSILEKFWSFLPKPNITFFVKIPQEIAFNRKDDIPSLNYLKIRNNYYENLSSDEIKIIDGTSNIEDLKKQIIFQIQKLKNE